MLILPIVEKLLELYKPLDLSKVRIIGVQHVLETTHSMFRSLFRVGLKPENVSIIGKCYSTCQEVLHEMLEDGIDVGLGSSSYSSHLPYDDLFADEVHSFLSSHLKDLSVNDYERVIVLDDGGKCINYFNQYNNLDINIIAIEQTTAGYEAIKSSRLKFPVINVARSPAKLNLESPMIAQAASERLYQSLKKRSISPDRALIIGGGAIGLAMKERLESDMQVKVYDQRKEISDYLNSLEELISSFPLIIGCTGRISIPHELHSYLLPNTVLVSTSSSDREFDAVHLRRKNLEESICHQDLAIQGLLLLNSGFPINFDGDRENIEPEKIQLTIALITAGILLGQKISQNCKPMIFPLNQQVEEWIKAEFLKYTREKDFLYPTEIEPRNRKKVFL